jgi:hypothetical protein
MVLLLLSVLFYGCGKDDGFFNPCVDQDGDKEDEKPTDEKFISAELNTQIYTFKETGDNKAEITGFNTGNNVKTAIKSMIDKNNGVFVISGNVLVYKTESGTAVNASTSGKKNNNTAGKYDYLTISSLARAAVPDEISALLTDIEIGDDITFEAASFSNFKSLEGLKVNATLMQHLFLDLYIPSNIKRLDISKINSYDIACSDHNLKGNSTLTKIVFPHGLKKIHEQALRDLSGIKVMDFSKVRQHIDSDYKAFNNCAGNITIYLPDGVRQYVGGTAGVDSFIEGEWPNGLNFLFSDTSTVYIGDRIVKSSSEPIGGGRWLE